MPMVATLVCTGLAAAAVAVTTGLVYRRRAARRQQGPRSDPEFTSQLCLVHAEVEWALEDQALVAEARTRVREAHRRG